MTGEALGYINDVMDSLKMPYAFDLWKGSPPELYFVGEYQESDADNQMDTGYEETAFTLSGCKRRNPSGICKAGNVTYYLRVSQSLCKPSN